MSEDEGVRSERKENTAIEGRFAQVTKREEGRRHCRTAHNTRAAKLWHSTSFSPLSA